MSLSELMDASKGVRGLTNMALAHEIAVDKNFELSKIQPENDLEKQIKEVMQRAFWDILKEQLASMSTQDMEMYCQGAKCDFEQHFRILQSSAIQLLFLNRFMLHLLHNA